MVVMHLALQALSSASLQACHWNKGNNSCIKKETIAAGNQSPQKTALRFVWQVKDWNITSVKQFHHYSCFKP